jgi:hypothetical protein
MNDFTPDEATRAQKTCLELLRLTTVLDKTFSTWVDDMKQATITPVRSKAIPVANNGKAPFQSYWLHYNSDIDSFLWTMYWSLSLQLHQVIKQLQSRHARLVAELGDRAVPLPQDLANLGVDDDTLDQYVENICASLSPQMNSFIAQESVPGLIGAQWYYANRGDSKKAQSFVELLNTIAEKNKPNIVGVKSHFLLGSG